MLLPMRRVDMRVGSVEWARSTVDYAKALWQHVENSEDRWRSVLHELDEGRAWEPLGFRSLDVLLRDTVGCNAAESIERVRELGKQGGDRRSEQARDQVDVIKLKGGTARSYILARLDRDGREDPEKATLAAAVRAGTMSAHAAATKAKYRHVKTPLEQLRHWWTKASTRERSAFLKEHAHE